MKPRTGDRSLKLLASTHFPFFSPFSFPTPPKSTKGSSIPQQTDEKAVGGWAHPHDDSRRLINQTSRTNRYEDPRWFQTFFLFLFFLYRCTSVSSSLNRLSTYALFLRRFWTIGYDLTSRLLFPRESFFNVTTVFTRASYLDSAPNLGFLHSESFAKPLKSYRALPRPNKNWYERYVVLQKDADSRHWITLKWVSKQVGSRAATAELLVFSYTEKFAPNASHR